jgi:hypothetical protein
MLCPSTHVPTYNTKASRLKIQRSYIYVDTYQGDQMSLGKSRPKFSPTRFCQN